VTQFYHKPQKKQGHSSDCLEQGPMEAIWSGFHKKKKKKADCNEEALGKKKKGGKKNCSRRILYI